jgi:DNA excision repair protein ERCC-8
VVIWDIRSSRSSLYYLDYERTKLKQKNKSNACSFATNSKAVAHTGSIIGLSYTSDGHHLMTLGKDNAFRLWDSHSGLNTQVNYGRVSLGSANAETCLQLSCTEYCNPNYVFVPCGNNLLMYNILEGELRQTFKGHFDSINCCFYNSAQAEIYTGSKDRNILIWSSEMLSKVSTQNESNAVSSSSKNSYSAILSGTSSSHQSNDNWSDEET